MTDEILQTVPDDADVYEATLAFEQALDAAPNDRALLRRWAARFPEFEDDFITIGYSRYALGTAEPVAVRPPITSLASESEARGLPAPDLARRLGLDKILLQRLDQRLLDAWTLPSALIDRLARALERTSEEVSAYLSGPPKLAGATHYRARSAPRMVQERMILQSPVRQPTFADEVRRSTQMSDEDKAFWLAEADKEGKGDDE